jgi:hypothetical protein
MTIQQTLYSHLSRDGTPNDCTVTELYRKAHRLPDDAETCLEDVEKWAFEVMNSERARHYWSSIKANR